jgi:hypothetical protein
MVRMSLSEAAAIRGGRYHRRSSVGPVVTDDHRNIGAAGRQFMASNAVMTDLFASSGVQ